MKLSVRVGTVDMNGYCGRSPHPEPRMNHGIFPVVSVRAETIGDEQPGDSATYVWTVRVPASYLTEMGSGSLDVELLPHEIAETLVNPAQESEIKVDR